jgi:hypothetical protein
VLPFPWRLLSKLTALLRDLLVHRRFEYDYVFDWTIVECMESLQRRSREVGLGLEDERGFRIVALVLDWLVDDRRCDCWKLGGLKVR